MDNNVNLPSSKDHNHFFFSGLLILFSLLLRPPHSHCCVLGKVREAADEKIKAVPTNIISFCMVKTFKVNKFPNTNPLSSTYLSFLSKINKAHNFEINKREQ